MRRRWAVATILTWLSGCGIGLIYLGGRGGEAEATLTCLAPALEKSPGPDTAESPPHYFDALRVQHSLVAPRKYASKRPGPRHSAAERQTTWCCLGGPSGHDSLWSPATGLGGSPSNFSQVYRRTVQRCGDYSGRSNGPANSSSTCQPAGSYQQKAGRQHQGEARPAGRGQFLVGQVRATPRCPRRPTEQYSDHSGSSNGGTGSGPDRASAVGVGQYGANLVFSARSRGPPLGSQFASFQCGGQWRQRTAWYSRSSVDESWVPCHCSRRWERNARRTRHVGATAWCFRKCVFHAGASRLLGGRRGSLSYGHFRRRHSGQAKVEPTREPTPPPVQEPAERARSLGRTMAEGCDRADTRTPQSGCRARRRGTHPCCVHDSAHVEDSMVQNLSPMLGAGFRGSGAACTIRMPGTGTCSAAPHFRPCSCHRGGRGIVDLTGPGRWCSNWSPTRRSFSWWSDCESGLGPAGNVLRQCPRSDKAYYSWLMRLKDTSAASMPQDLLRHRSGCTRRSCSARTSRSQASCLRPGTPLLCASCRPCHALFAKYRTSQTCEVQSCESA